MRGNDRFCYVFQFVFVIDPMLGSVHEQVNVRGTFECGEALPPVMARQGYGKIRLFSSNSPINSRNRLEIVAWGKTHLQR
ncbi:MAG: hypothetical protein ABSC37_03050 [Xanthobacteraceae bacterium]